MANNVRPESMARITTKALADEFIKEQIKLLDEYLFNPLQKTTKASTTNKIDIPTIKIVKDKLNFVII